MESQQEKNWAIACHLSSLTWIVLACFGIGFIPFLNIIIPAIIWSLKKGDSKLVNDHGKESVNFQISMSIYGTVLSIVLFILIVILVALLFAVGATEGDLIATLLSMGAGLGLVVVIVGVVAIAIFEIIVVIIAATKAKDGQMYRYPFNLRLLAK